MNRCVSIKSFGGSKDLLSFQTMHVRTCVQDIVSSVHLDCSEGNIQLIPVATLNPHGVYSLPGKLLNLTFVSLLHGFIWAKFITLIEDRSDSVIQTKL